MKLIRPFYSPYEQGWNAAQHDFSWCSRMVRSGVTRYASSDSNYAKNGDFENANAWRDGYRDYFAKMNARPRKHQVPLPEFY